ncbi:YggS family pyridoxal phosphate-dependent enzyme [Mycobacterium sp. SM1]|uniref:YggS family pyridoxal phosphate-dependent enzyme n=1 Tax=Mycobacterium sp. SM1 TaxID=2816243 RepID=UPI001BD0539B|nr:YggS family pyridoxal phosphate-dependent enzyme [Mycobacterium sp. SM1]MBS4730386.1 YggS family pyridoxal phosphate-dependent enzyme [Mycobacterium sp. SM1]
MSPAIERLTRESELSRALASVHARLAAAAQAAGRAVDEIELLPVTKFFPATDVAILVRLGCHSIGESREQEAWAKIGELAALLGPEAQQVRWHMVGRIQRNKVPRLARWAHTVHSVDSLRVVTALDRAVGAALADGHRSAPLRVYVQISLDGDPARGGVDISLPRAVDAICAGVAASQTLELAGLMGIPPLSWDPEKAFARLHAEHRRVLESYPNAVGLSAGMSDDFEIAVKHGSTCVRVGTALLGPRPLRSP